MKTGSKFLIAVLAVATAPLLAGAQTPPPGPPGGISPGPGGPQMRQRMGPRMGGQMRGGRMHFGRRGMGMRGRMGLGRLLRNPAMRERLGVTPEQATKIQAQDSTFAKAQVQNQAKLRVKRMELDELLAADKPDRALIDKKMRELNEAQFAEQKAAMDHRLAMREALTPEQKEKMQQWMQEQRQQPMQRPMGPGPRGPRPPMTQPPAPPAEQPGK